MSASPRGGANVVVRHARACTLRAVSASVLGRPFAREKAVRGGSGASSSRKQPNGRDFQ